MRQNDWRENLQNHQPLFHPDGSWNNPLSSFVTSVASVCCSAVWELFVIQDVEQVLSLPKRYLQQPSAGGAEHLDLELDGEVDHDEGDSFFDDPLPKPLKTYGW